MCHRDGVPHLMFRVGDMRKSHIIEAHVRAQIIRRKVINFISTLSHLKLGCLNFKAQHIDHAKMYRDYDH